MHLWWPPSGSWTTEGQDSQFATDYACVLSHVWLFATPWTARIFCTWNFPGKNTGMGFHFLLQGIFPTQGLNLSLRFLALVGGFFTTELPAKPTVLGSKVLGRWELPVLANAPGWSPVQGRCVISHMAVGFEASVYVLQVDNLGPRFVTNSYVTMGKWLLSHEAHSLHL